MPIDILTKAVVDGPETVLGWEYIKVITPVLAGLTALKLYFRGATNTWERDMHGKVFMVTGGTSGLGQQIVFELATKGAQIILLTRSTEDIWIVDQIEDLRERTNNQMIYAETCDLSSLYSIRKFCTKWLDNQPPRRLDGVICCAAESLPIGKDRHSTVDGVERQIAINYLGHYHLLTLLGPSLRVQAPDRDVRVLVAMCASQAMGQVDVDDILWEKRKYNSRQPLKVYGTSKLMLGLFIKEYQRRLDKYERKDKAPCNVRINMVNPGLMRSPSTRRFASLGTVTGLIIYLLLMPLWLIVLKSTSQGAQPFFFALYAPIFQKSEGGQYIQECKINTRTKREYKDEELQRELFDKTEALIQSLEKQSAIERKKQEIAKKDSKPSAAKAETPKANSKAKKATKTKGSAKQTTRVAKELDDELYVKPETPEELEYKLNVLRNHVGIPSLPSDEPPLFPGSAPSLSSASGSNAAQDPNASKHRSARKA